MKSINKKSVDIVIPVYEEKEHLATIIDNLTKQSIPPNYVLNIIIVDDASTDGTPEYIEKNLLSETVSLIKLEKNSGPAVARNKGCLAGNGDILVLIDADCLPDSSDFIAEHIQALKKNDISCGAMASNIPDSIFWSQYQNEVFENRAAEYNKNKGSMFTTSNLAFSRNHFIQVSGFDEQYFFGFEDRDFLLRSEEAGALITYTSKALVVHIDRLTVTSICKKMKRGGEVESNIFRKRHPEAYKIMPYYKVDAREHAYLVPIAKFVAPLFSSQSSHLDKVLKWNWFPYKLKKLMVKGMTALCYMSGTAKS